MDIKLDRRIYADECISKAVYALSGDYAINRTLAEPFETLHIEPLNAPTASTDMEKKVMATLNDYKLRQIIERETHDIRTILYIKAFADWDNLA